MGLGILEFLRQKVTKQQKTAFIGTFCFGLLIHLYMFSNYLPNRDAVLNFYTDQNMLISGRWALSLACGVSSYFNLPWIIGICSIFFIALTAVLVVTIFRITNPILILLTGGLLVSAPAISETFFFLFTADGYMIAMFLSALSVYLSRIGENRKLAMLVSSACICVSCGIYQAYVSFALILAVCYFMNELFLNSAPKTAYFKWILRQVCVFTFALVSYYLIWKLLLKVTNTAPSNYQGIDKVGTISADLLLNGLIRAFKSCANFFIQWNIFKFGLTPYIALNLLFIVCFIVGIIIAVIKSRLLSHQEWWKLILVLLCLLAIVPFACIWHFVSNEVSYRAMMLHSLTILFIFTGMNFENWANHFSKNLVGLLLGVIIFNNALIANIGYTYLHLSYENSFAEATEILSEYRSLSQDHEINRIAVLGSRWDDVMMTDIDPMTGEPTPIAQINVISDTIDKSLLYNSQQIYHYLNYVFQLDLEYVHRAERYTIFNLPEVQAMNCWPEDNSICVIDDILVIKLDNKWDE